MRRLLIALALFLLPSLAYGQHVNQCVGWGCPTLGGTFTLPATFSGAVTFSSTTTHTGQATFANGTVGAPSIAWTNSLATGFYRPASNQVGISINGALQTTFGNNFAIFGGNQFGVSASSVVVAANTTQMGFASGTVSAGTAIDTGWTRLAAGVLAGTNGTITTRRWYLGGGAAVASATALPVPTGAVFHVTGTTVITSITTTNLGSGACFTMIFDGITTVTDGSNLVLAGNFVTTADDSLSVCFDGTNFVEVARSVN